MRRLIGLADQQQILYQRPGEPGLTCKEFRRGRIAIKNAVAIHRETGETAATPNCKAQRNDRFTGDQMTGKVETVYPAPAFLLKLAALEPSTECYHANEKGNVFIPIDNNRRCEFYFRYCVVAYSPGTAVGLHELYHTQAYYLFRFCRFRGMNVSFGLSCIKRLCICSISFCCALNCLSFSIRYKVSSSIFFVCKVTISPRFMPFLAISAAEGISGRCRFLLMKDFNLLRGRSL